MNKLFCCYKVKEGRRGEGGRKERREERKKKSAASRKVLSHSPHYVVVLEASRRPRFGPKFEP